MALKKAFVTVGLGFGDEAKGATVDYLCRKHKADLVVRYSGGSQCGHNVELPGGLRHCFSQFGSGTLAGVPTYIGPNVIIYPEAMRNEAGHLKELGVAWPFDMLTVDPKCLVSTVYHRAVNRLKEISRGASKHGSCGHGVGETRNYWLKYGQDAIFAEDLSCTETLWQKLSLMRQRYLLDMQEFIDRVPRDAEQLKVFGEPVTELALRLGSGTIPKRGKMPINFNVAIFEGAQGVLLDEWNGFHPYTTWSTVTPYHAHELIAEARMSVGNGYVHEVEVTTVGCTRPYSTRHGAGPLPGYDEAFTKHVNDPGNPWNEWQENFRVGWFDMPLMEYAAKVVGKIDYLAVSCVDHLKTWSKPIKASCIDHLKTWSKPIKARKKSLWEHPREPQYRMSVMSANAKKPFLTPHQSVEEFQETTFDEIMEMLSRIAPIGVMADGPTWEHRVSSWEK